MTIDALIQMTRNTNVKQLRVVLENLQKRFPNKYEMFTQIIQSAHDDKKNEAYWQKQVDV